MLSSDILRWFTGKDTVFNLLLLGCLQPILDVVDLVLIGPLIELFLTEIEDLPPLALHDL